MCDIKTSIEMQMIFISFTAHQKFRNCLCKKPSQAQNEYKNNLPALNAHFAICKTFEERERHMNRGDFVIENNAAVQVTGE